MTPAGSRRIATISSLISLRRRWTRRPAGQSSTTKMAGYEKRPTDTTYRSFDLTPSNTSQAGRLPHINYLQKGDRFSCYEVFEVWRGNPRARSAYAYALASPRPALPNGFS